jgi:CubicO group peptidase (beta-lactamase class C family)
MHGTLVLTDNQHIYKTFSETVLKGRLTPSIYDLDNFPKRAIPAENPKPWEEHAEYNRKQLSKESVDYLKKMKTVAFLVIKDGKIYYERYSNEHDKNSLSNSFSMAKTIVGLLIGAAIDDGYIQSVNQPVGDFIPEFNKGEKKKITIKHLLTMTSGIEFGEQYMNPFGYMAKAYYGDDLWDITVEKPLRHSPGKIWKYQGGNTLLLSFVLEMATGKKISTYFSQKIWNTLGAEQTAYWSLDKEDGREKSFCCFYATARDFARLGQMCLDSGKFQTTQVLNPYYIKTATTPINFAYDEQNEQVNWYGYSFWILNHKNMQIPYFRGILGQYIFIIPEKNAVVVRLGHRREEKRENHHPVDTYKYIDIALQLLE